MKPTDRWLEDLETWGPDSSSSSTMSVQKAHEYCRDFTRSQYENFPVVSWLMPRKLHQPFYSIYCFCRWADNLSDEISSTQQSLRLLSWWREELNGCFLGQCRHPVMISLKDHIDHFPLSQQPFEDLISAFEQDQVKSRYQTFDELLNYCQYSANPVGRILLQLTNCHDENCLVLSDAICTGLQLVNFWQDVARDSQIDRIYLPEEDMKQFSVNEEQILSLSSTPELINLIQFQVERSENYLRAGYPLSQLAPKSIRNQIRLFALGGLKTAEKIRQIDFRVLDQRPKLNQWDFLSIFLRAFLSRR